MARKPRSPAERLARGADWKIKTAPGRPAWPMPERPWELSAAAGAEWDRRAPVLWQRGQLTQAQADTLARLCELTADIAAARKSLDKAGPIIKTRDGEVEHPASRVVARLMPIALAHEKALGIFLPTPEQAAPPVESEPSMLSAPEPVDDGAPYRH